MLCQKIGNESPISQSAIITGEMHLGPGGTKILDAGGESCRADSVVQRHPLHLLRRLSAAVAAFAEQIADVGQERCLTAAAGDEGFAFFQDIFSASTGGTWIPAA